jgi:hypothetical protein
MSQRLLARWNAKFVKGDPRAATAAYGPVEVALPDEAAAAVDS